MSSNFREQKQEQKQTEIVHKQTEKIKAEVYSCPNCGSTCGLNDIFCMDCGYTLKGASCKYCGGVIEPDREICPKCGHPLHSELCSFCGAKMTEQDTFCPECGEPHGGISCPQCQTLNYRSFCRKCNYPLNGMALVELERAKSDPKFQKVISLAQELAELEEYILSFGKEEVLPETPELSDENKELIAQYKDLLSAFHTIRPEQEPLKSKPKTPKPEPESESKSESKPESKSKTKINLSFSVSNAEDAVALYKQKLDEMQNTLKDMVPEPGTTPQMQRNYYSARKVNIVTNKKILIQTSWVCNAYGCEHTFPEDCAKPWMGGKWIYKESEEITTTWGYN